MKELQQYIDMIGTWVTSTERPGGSMLIESICIHHLQAPIFNVAGRGYTVHCESCTPIPVDPHLDTLPVVAYTSSELGSKYLGLKHDGSSSCVELTHRQSAIEAIEELNKQIQQYKRVCDDHDRLVKKLDVAINGINAAESPSLCDIVSQLEKLRLTQIQ